MMTSRSAGLDLLKLIVVVGLVVICSPPVMTQEPPASWTFLVYLDGDNNLEDAAIDDLNEMEVVGSTADANIVVQIDHTPTYHGIQMCEGAGDVLVAVATVLQERLVKRDAIEYQSGRRAAMFCPTRPIFLWR